MKKMFKILFGIIGVGAICEVICDHFLEPIENEIKKVKVNDPGKGTDYRSKSQKYYIKDIIVDENKVPIGIRFNSKVERDRALFNLITSRDKSGSFWNLHDLFEFLGLDVYPEYYVYENCLVNHLFFNRYLYEDEEKTKVSLIFLKNLDEAIENQNLITCNRDDEIRFRLYSYKIDEEELNNDDI